MSFRRKTKVENMENDSGGFQMENDSGEHQIGNDSWELQTEINSVGRKTVMGIWKTTVVGCRCFLGFRWRATRDGLHADRLQADV